MKRLASPWRTKSVNNTEASFVTLTLLQNLLWCGCILNDIRGRDRHWRPGTRIGDAAFILSTVTQVFGYVVFPLGLS